MGRRWAARVLLAAGFAAVVVTASRGPHQVRQTGKVIVGYCIADNSPSDPYACYTAQQPSYCLVNGTKSILAPTPTDPCHTIPRQ